MALGITKIPKVMTIAGSDSGGGAGIQADLKTIAALGGYGTSTITAITAQNTKTVTAIHEIPIDIIKAQYRAIMEDIGASAIKIGMLSSAEIIKAVAQLLDEYPVPHIILDPVMIAKSGAQLLKEEAVDALASELLPRCTLLTPNIPETEKLVDFRISSDESIEKAAYRLKEIGVKAALIKGGHLDRRDIVNTLFDGNEFHRFTARRLDNKFTHGTGCTLSSAIATYCAGGMNLPDAVSEAVSYVSSAMEKAYAVGSGVNPLNHMYSVIKQNLNISSTHETL